MSQTVNTRITTLRPPRGIRGPHVQSILGSGSIRGRIVRLLSQDFVKTSSAQIIQCDNNAQLLAKMNIPTENPKAVVVVLHGWEGSAESTYMVSVGNKLLRDNNIVVRLNFRDHGGTQALNEELFHSCRIGEVESAIKTIAQMHDTLPLYLLGFSLGGNFALRVAARASATGIALKRAVAICPVIEPRNTMAALESGLWVYRHYFLKRWRRSLRLKAQEFPQLYQFGNLNNLPTLTATTEYFVDRYTEFESLDDYLDGYAITGDVLENLQVESLLIATRDDPVIPAVDLNHIARSTALRIELLEHGGHCGLLQDYRLRSWVNTSLNSLLFKDLHRTHASP